MPETLPGRGFEWVQDILGINEELKIFIKFIKN